jgi:hypothetical protein
MRLSLLSYSSIRLTTNLRPWIDERPSQPWSRVSAGHGNTQSRIVRALPAVTDFGALESHDHEGVNSRLKGIATMTGATIQPGLNAEVTQRLAKLKGVPSAEFDSYYVADMKQIHNNDEGLFAQEAEGGSAPYKDFAHQKAVLVKAHLGWLNTM